MLGGTGAGQSSHRLVNRFSLRSLALKDSKGALRRRTQSPGRKHAYGERGGVVGPQAVAVRLKFLGAKKDGEASTVCHGGGKAIFCRVSFTFVPLLIPQLYAFVTMIYFYSRLPKAPWA